MNEIISLVNQKGGTGKTTACVNLAAGLSISNYRTILIDLDPQSNATLAMGIDIEHLPHSMYDVFLNQVRFHNIFHKINDNLTIAPASMELINTDISLEGHQTRLKDILKNYKRDYDFILIDCPPTLNLLTINALTASDEVLIPILCDYFSLEGLKQLLKTITKVQNNFNKNLRILGILPNLVDHRRNFTTEILKIIKKEFKDLVFSTEIPISVSLAEASSFGKNIFSYASWSTGALAYQKATKELLKKLSNKQKQPYKSEVLV